MRSILRILSSARQFWPLYVGIVVCSALVTATGLLTPFIIKAATDAIVGARNGTGSATVSTVVLLAVALLVTELVNTLIVNVGGYLGDMMAVRLRTQLSSRYFEKLLSLPQRYFDNELTGTVINRLSRSITEVTSFLNMFANNFFPMLLSVAAIEVIVAFYYWPLALLLAVIYPLFTWLTARTSVRWQELEGKKNHEYDVAGGRFAESVGQVRVVKSFVQEARELRLFRARFDAAVDLTSTQSRYWHRMDVSRRAGLNAIFFGVFAIIFVRTMQGHFSIGVMVLLIQLVAMARQPVFGMSFLVDSVQRAIANSKDYFAVMSEEPEPGAVLAAEPAVGVAAQVGETGGVAEVRAAADSRDDGDGGPAGRGPEIMFESVSFGYGTSGEVLREVDFTVPAGRRVALVSESGGGKTTLVSLLLRLYRADAGRIRIAGREIEDWPLADLRGAVGVVFQDPSLFSGTIAENIAYGRPEATEEEIRAAAHKAHAHEFISRFDDGYAAHIGERGLKLSGGQKQRIAIARAICKDAPVLVLDEATSSLDSRSERLVHDGLENLMAGRTTLIIAHRLSTIASVDRIVTLRDGRVDEVGPPAELAESGGIYAELLALQASASKRDRKRMQQRFDIRV